MAWLAALSKKQNWTLTAQKLLPLDTPCHRRVLQNNSISNYHVNAFQGCPFLLCHRLWIKVETSSQSDQGNPSATPVLIPLTPNTLWSRNATQFLGINRVLATNRNELSLFAEDLIDTEAGWGVCDKNRNRSLSSSLRLRERHSE